MSNQGPPPSGPVPKPGRYLKISLYLRKQPNVTDAYFHAYWANNHLEPALKNKTFTDKTRRYNQVPNLSPCLPSAGSRMSACLLTCEVS